MKSKKVPMAQVIRDCRDGNKDYSIPLSVAKQLHEEGKLWWDPMNRAFSTPPGANQMTKVGAES